MEKGESGKGGGRGGEIGERGRKRGGEWEKGAEEGGEWGKGTDEGGEWGKGAKEGAEWGKGAKEGAEWGKGTDEGGEWGKGAKEGEVESGNNAGLEVGGRALVNNRKRIITKRFETFNLFHFNTLNSLKDLLIPYKFALDESSFTSSPFDARKEPDVTRQFLIDSLSVKFFSCLTDQKQVRTLNAFQVCPHVLIG